MRPPTPFSIWRFGGGRTTFIGRAISMASARAWLRQLRWQDDALYIAVDERMDGDEGVAEDR